MTHAPDLPPADLAILRHVLRSHLPADTEFWVFGSRATGKARRYSDLDLAVQAGERLSWDLLGALNDALSESDLTIKVDVLDLHAVESSFRQKIENDMVPLSLADTGP